MKAIAFCGLACCVCSENKGCVGCQDVGCESHGWCKNYNCCKEKGLNGCWECSEFPFTGCMLDKPRIRAFAEFARRYGVEELEKCLLRNKEKGIVYHYESQLVGDYDKCQTEEEIIEMIYPAEESIVCKLGYDKISMFDTYKAILDMDILKYHDDGLIVRITGEKKMLHVFAKYQIKGE